MKHLITLPTIDHGDVTLPEPGWCTGHAGHIPGYRVDLTHFGTQHDLTFEGNTLLVAMLSQDPFATVAERRRTGLYVELADFSGTLDPAEVRQFAATLTVHAMHLRRLADDLAVIQAEEGGR
ncbi:MULTISPECIES: DUF6907 domain-containing protein [unclassified Streptomyces]|uniref:DUF6907 domain-containing protein n=1 Tax=unclassified Streptomyces TaxID=2593676 RepID=UPI0006AE9B81|nr:MULTISPECIES: hypothetical protein [unclassified Streptomyces]